MNEPLNLDKFTQYVAAHSDLLPLLSFEARAIVADEPPQPVSEAPAGRVILYPGFVVFLTEEQPATDATVGLTDRPANYPNETAAYPDTNPWSNAPSASYADLARVAVGKYRDVDVLENAIATPYSVFIPVRDVTEVKTGRHMMTHHYITIATPTWTLQLCQDDTKPREGSMISHLFGEWQEGFVTILQELVQSSRPDAAAGSRRQPRFVTDLYGNALPVGSRGTETNEHGDAIHGDGQNYKSDAYYGRVSHGAELMLMSNLVCQNQFGLDIIKVKVLTNEWQSEIGAIGWVDLEDTSFNIPEAS